MKNVCKNCKWWSRADDSYIKSLTSTLGVVVNAGYCHYLPQTIEKFEENFCSKFEAKEDVDNGKD